MGLGILELMEGSANGLKYKSYKVPYSNYSKGKKIEPPKL